MEEIKTYDPDQFKIASLLEWLGLRNSFNEAKRLIDDIRINMNKVKISKEDKKVFSDLNKLIIDINNKTIKKLNCLKAILRH